ncbi:MAG TPA: glycosyltransferase family 9 protein [Ktedonobacterales bacterium]|jgi:ADP-heptose:LPS heptosyltransferase
MEKIVVFRPGALGDTLLAFPALAALRRVFVGCWLCAIGNAPALALARDAGLIDEALPFDDLRWADLLSAAGIRSAETRQTLAGARLAVLWLRDSDGLAALNLRALGITPVLSAPGRPPAGARIHAADYLLGTLAPLLGDEQVPADMPLLEPSAAARAWAEQEWTQRGLGERPVLMLHPGSGGHEKCWPPERFAALAGRFMANGWRALVSEGPADAPAAAALLAALAAPRAERLTGLTLPQLAALLARTSSAGPAALYVGNDSGVSHLSAMLGVPTLALFGPTDPAIWAPRGPRARVVRAGAAAAAGLALAPMTALSVDAVYDAALAALRSDR